MSTKFDAIRALREEISGLNEIRLAIETRARRAMQVMSEAEIEYNSIVKLRAFADAEIERKRAILTKLSDEGATR